jgi:hypothetical protein
MNKNDAVDNLECVHSKYLENLRILFVIHQNARSCKILFVGVNVPPSGVNVPPSGVNVPPSGVNVPPSGVNVTFNLFRGFLVIKDLYKLYNYFSEKLLRFDIF